MTRLWGSWVLFVTTLSRAWPTTTKNEFFSVLYTKGSRPSQARFYPSINAAFGPKLSENRQLAILYDAQSDGCEPFKLPHPYDHYARNGSGVAVLLVRGGCSFDQKVLEAQNAGANLAIVYNDTGVYDEMANLAALDLPDDIVEYRALVRMTGSKHAHQITIPSIFISRSSALELKTMNTEKNERGSYTRVLVFLLETLPHYSNNSDGYDNDFSTYFWAFFIIMLSLSTLTAALIALNLTRYIAYRRQLAKRQSLSRWTLRSIALKQITPEVFKSDIYPPTCAICLDELVTGSYYRDIPCGHLFHQECLDGWLLQQSRLCPTCRHDVTSREKYQQQKIITSNTLELQALDCDETPLLQEVKNECDSHTAPDFRDYNRHSPRCKWFE